MQCRSALRCRSANISSWHCLHGSSKAFSSSVGSKFLIAFTGLSLLVFLVAHLAGNLLFIAGPAAFNEYSHKLVSNPLVYVAELGLLAVFALHIFKTVGMFAGSYAARPQRYAKKKWAKSKNDSSRKSVSSSTMILTGTITLLFVVTHLATFKFGTYYETPEGIRDLYRLQLSGIQPSRLRRLLCRGDDRHRVSPLARRVERDAVVRHR